MRTFSIVATTSRAKTFDFEATNDCAVLYAANQFGLEDAAVFEAGAYKYSLRRESGVWCIYTRVEPS